MRILDQKFEIIRNDFISMLNLIEKQLLLSFKIFIEPDAAAARKVIKNEVKVDRFDFKLNKDCEKFLVVCAPLADDLRKIMTVNNILPSLERIGDICEKLARFTKKYPENINDELLEKLELKTMFLNLEHMYNTVMASYSDQSTYRLRDVFVRDLEVNRINKQAKSILLDYIGPDKDANEKLVSMLLLLSQLERIGDYIKTISEEIYFGVEGSFMRHKL